MIAAERKSGNHLDRRVLILEVGVGNNPFPTNSTHMIAAHKQYLGVDRSEQRACVSQKLIREQRFAHPGQLNIICADGQNLPLRNGSVSKVVFVNVFGATSYRKQFPQFVREARRVLCEEGCITVVETYTPPPPRKIERLMEKERLYATEETPSYDDARIAQYKLNYRPPGKPFEPPYVVLFKRKRLGLLANVARILFTKFRP